MHSLDSIDMLRNHFTMQMAGLVIEIDTTSPRTCILCRHYLYEGKPDIRIKVTEDDIQQERLLCDKPENKEIFLETVAAYRKIVEETLLFNTFLVHGAVISINNTSFMFTAPSGTGKTTHIKLWKSKADDVVVINGDKPLIRITNDEVLACGTPWSGNEHLNTNTMVPLKAIVLMERSDNNEFTEISFSQAFPFLLQQTHLPKDPYKVRMTLNLLSQLYGRVTFYHFKFNNFKDDCFDVAYNTLVGNKQ